MKVLYVASDQHVPGRTGGSTHVLEVAQGLAARGHCVHAVVSPGTGESREEIVGGVRWHRIAWTPSHRFFRFRARAQVEALARSVQPDVAVERYYNFGGEGVRAAKRLGIPSVLEVNSPIVDHAGSVKAWLDAALLARPMRRYRESLCRSASALVSPLLSIVPEFARGKTEIVTWGANVDAFHPQRRTEALRSGWGVSARTTVVLFSGSFRPWHGVHVFEEAARFLHKRDDLYFVLAGGSRRGPAQGFRGQYLGALPYGDMPATVASCDIGVAPYDTERQKQLRLGFYWSPLKIFEYMASGLPTVTIRREPLSEIVRQEREGLLIEDADPRGLAHAIERLAEDSSLREALGRSARARVVERYSWARHCEQLEAVLRKVASR